MTESIADIQKYYIGAQELLELSYELGKNIIEDNFKPTFVIAIWRGGTVIGIAIQELFKYFDIKTDHISIRTSSYIGMNQSSDVRVHGLEYIVEHANQSDSILLVDDIFDTGRSVNAVITKLKTKMRNNLPHDIRIATILYKPQNNKTNIVPNYFISTTDKWVVFPHELEGMNLEEIKLSKGSKVAKIISSISNTVSHDVSCINTM
jgi:uncharacterized protein